MLAAAPPWVSLCRGGRRTTLVRGGRRYGGRSRLPGRARSRLPPRHDEDGGLGCEAVQIADSFRTGSLQECRLDLEAATREDLPRRNDALQGDEAKDHGPPRPDGAELDDLLEPAPRPADKHRVGLRQVVERLRGLALDHPHAGAVAG